MAKFCTNCGNEIREEDNVCSKCGKVLKGDRIQPKKSNDMAIAGFVTSLLSIFCCAPAGIIGLILSIMGLKAKDCDDSSKGLAIAGIIISAIALVLLIIIILLYATVFIEAINSSY